MYERVSDFRDFNLVMTSLSSLAVMWGDWVIVSDARSGVCVGR